MKQKETIFFSLFFTVAISVHIYYLISEVEKQYLWHLLYFITYGTCWWMLFLKSKLSVWVYGLMACFPFFTHAYFSYKHLHTLDAMFWICILVCIVLSVGFFQKKIS